MQIDVSTFNLLLGSLIALQVWTVKTLYHVKGKLYHLQSQLDVHEKIHHPQPSKPNMKKSLALIALCLFAVGCSSTGQLVRPVIEQPVVTQQPDGTTATNLVTVVAPEWKATLDAIATTGQIVPPPVGSWVSLGAAGIAALLAAYARNRQAKAEDVAATIIQGIESMATTVAPSAKEAVNNVARIKGNSAEVHAAVKKLTK